MNGRKHDCRRYGHVRPSECRPQRPPNAAYSFPPASVADFTSQINTFIRKTPCRGPAARTATQRCRAGVPPPRNGKTYALPAARAQVRRDSAGKLRPRRACAETPRTATQLCRAGVPPPRPPFAPFPARRSGRNRAFAPCRGPNAPFRTGRLKRKRLPGESGRRRPERPSVLRPWGPWLPSRSPRRNAWRPGYVQKVRPASSPGVRPRCG